MSPLKFVLLVLVAQLGLSVVASTTAAATETKAEFIVEKSAIGNSETVQVSGTSGVTKIEYTVAEIPVTTECKRDAIAGAIKAGGVSASEITFRECSFPTIPSCVIREPFGSKLTDQLIGNGGLEDEFTPKESNEIFMEFKVEGSLCVFRGDVFVIRGTQRCELPGVEMEATAHTIECLPSGSKLRFGTREAKFTSTEHVHLISGKKWSAR